MGNARTVRGAIGALVVGAALVAVPAAGGGGVPSAAAGPAPAPTGITSWGAGPGFNSFEHTLPPGAEQVFIDVRGARGGNGEGAATGGLGGRVVGELTLEPEATISLSTGSVGGHANQHIPGAAGPGAGAGGAGVAANDGNAGGAGGGSGELGLGVDPAPEDLLVVAGGGGGAGGAHQPATTGSGGAGSGGGPGGDGRCGTNPGLGGGTSSGGAGGGAANGGLAGVAGTSTGGGAGGASNGAQGDGGGGGGDGRYGGGGGGGNATDGVHAGCGGGGSGLAPEGMIAQSGVVAGDPRVSYYRCYDPCTPSFTDVDRGHAFFWEIEILDHASIAEGYEDGGFHPSATMSRQAMAAFIARYLGIDEEDMELPAEPTFSDVSPSHPFYWQIEWMNAAGISTGYDDGTFRPSAPITRQSMSAFLMRAAFSDGTPIGDAPTFSDVGASHPFHEAIEWMSSFSITTGYEDGTFRPGAPVTRQAMAAFLLRFQPLAGW